MARVCPIFGPKMSVFCMVLSGWGIIFLGFLGVFFYLEASTLFAELGYEQAGAAFAVPEVQTRYKSAAHSCWIAAALYAVTLVGVFWQNKWNSNAPF